MSCGSTYTRRVRDSFDKAASSYDKYSAIQRSVARELCSLVRGIDGRRVLDVGCGTGHVGEVISTCCEFFQVDISKEMCSAASRKNHGLTVSCDMKNIPFPDGFFDVVTSSMAVHWASDVGACLQSMLRVLNKTGQGLFVSVPVCGTLEELAVCERLVGRERKFTFHDVTFFIKLVSALGGVVEYVQCKKYVLHYKTCVRLLDSIAKTGTQLYRDTTNFRGESVLDVLRVYGNLFSRGGMVVSSWNIAYLVIKKRSC